MLVARPAGVWEDPSARTTGDEGLPGRPPRSARLSADWFARATQWFIRLAAANHEYHMWAYLRQLERTPLIVIDEVGYIPFDAEAPNLFFRLVSSRCEQGSVIVTSNKPFTV